MNEKQYGNTTETIALWAMFAFIAGLLFSAGLGIAKPEGDQVIADNKPYIYILDDNVFDGPRGWYEIVPVPVEIVTVKVAK